jgi:hypothetical protein
VYKYHIFLIHSSLVGHLGCFHGLAIVNSGCNKHGCAGVSLLYPYIPSGMSLGVVLLDHRAFLVLGFSFLRSLHTVFTIYNPISSV